jgi:hypothetical protein
MVDLVTHESNPMLVAPAGEGGQLVPVQHGPSWVAGAGDDQTIGQGIERLQHRDGWLEARLAAGLEDHRLHPEGGQDVHVGRIIGRSQGNAVALVETGEKGERERSGCAGGDCDPPRRQVDAVPRAIMLGDAPTQARQAEGLRVAEGMVHR